MRIEGHTSSEWDQEPEKTAFKKYEFIPSKTRSVLEYSFSLKELDGSTFG